MTQAQFEEYRRSELSWRVGLGERLDKIDKGVARINGSVADLTAWRWMLTGGLAVLTFFVGSGAVTTAIVLAVTS